MLRLFLLFLAHLREEQGNAEKNGEASEDEHISRDQNRLSQNLLYAVGSCELLDDTCIWMGNLGKSGKTSGDESSPSEDLAMPVPSWKHVVFFALPHTFLERTRRGQKVHEYSERSKTSSELSGRGKEKQGSVGTSASIASNAARSAAASCFRRNGRKVLL